MRGKFSKIKRRNVCNLRETDNNNKKENGEPTITHSRLKGAEQTHDGKIHHKTK